MTGNTLQLQDFHMRNWNYQRKVLCFELNIPQTIFSGSICAPKVWFSLPMVLLGYNLINIMLCESHVCVPTNWSTLIKWLSFGSFKKIALGSSEARIIKYSIFWSGNAPKILKKTKKKSIFWQRIKILKIFLMITKDYCLN